MVLPAAVRGTDRFVGDSGVRRVVGVAVWTVDVWTVDVDDVAIHHWLRRFSGL